MTVFLGLIVGALVISGTPHLATREEVLASAKAQSVQWCSGTDVKCEFSVSGEEEGWSVAVRLAYVTSEGKRSYTPGGDRVYIFSVGGELLKVLDGL